MSALHPGYCFDAAAVLGIRTPSSKPLPQPAPGEVVLRISAELTLQTLRDSHFGRQLMWQQDWYDIYPWSSTPLPASVYRLRLPVPRSHYKTFAEQQAMLPLDEQVAPVVLVAVALLCIAWQGGRDPLDGRWTRCIERSAGGHRVVLGWGGGRLYVGDYWHGIRHGDVVASASC